MRSCMHTSSISKCTRKYFWELKEFWRSIIKSVNNCLLSPGHCRTPCVLDWFGVDQTRQSNLKSRWSPHESESPQTRLSKYCEILFTLDLLTYSRISTTRNRGLNLLFWRSTPEMYKYSTIEGRLSRIRTIGLVNLRNYSRFSQSNRLTSASSSHHGVTVEQKQIRSQEKRRVLKFKSPKSLLNP
jgi:hypothetical protein